MKAAELERDSLSEAALWSALKQKGAGQAREALFTLHYPFARGLARKRFFKSFSADVEFAELCQLASTGLLEAIDHFNPDLGVPFRGYAARRISGSILNGIAKMSEMREQISYRNSVRRDRAKSLSPNGIETMATSQALDALADMAVGLALGFMLDETAFRGLEDQPDPGPSAYDGLAWKEMVGRMISEIDKLPERDQAIVRMHYLEGMGFEQIGAVLRLTKGRISQIHRTALGLLRSRLSDGDQFRLER